MQEGRIAYRYARALFEPALEMDILEAVYKDMLLVREVINENKDFCLFLANPVVRADKKKIILHEIFEKHLNKITMLFLDIITKSDREDYLKLIANKFIKLYKQYKRIITTTLQTVVKIDEDTREKLIKLLEDQTKSKIELIEELDEDLIGGFVFKYENLEYDASIRRQIQRLKRDFKSNLYIKGF